MYLTTTYGTNNPAMLILRGRGYDVNVVCYRRKDGSAYCTFHARKEDLSLAADSGTELLGLAEAWERFGEAWNKQPDIMDEIISETEAPEDA